MKKATFLVLLKLKNTTCYLVFKLFSLLIVTKCKLFSSIWPVSFFFKTQLTSMIKMERSSYVKLLVQYKCDVCYSCHGLLLVFEILSKGFYWEESYDLSNSTIAMQWSLYRKTPLLDGRTTLCGHNLCALPTICMTKVTSLMWPHPVMWPKMLRKMVGLLVEGPLYSIHFLEM